MSESTIMAYYAKDHDRLDNLFHVFQELKRSDFAQARASFSEFRTGLERHIRWEEEILFPLFEEKAGITQGGPIAVMRMEHEQIKWYLAALQKKVDEQEPDSEPEEQVLVGTLHLHNEKEENVLYPAIDRLLSEEEVRLVFQAMENIPLEPAPAEVTQVTT